MKRLILFFVLFTSYAFAFENITVENFNDKVKNKKVIVDFYAPWCPPCKIISKELILYDKTQKDGVHIFKVNIDKQRDLLKRFDVKSIPTLVFLKNGKALYKEVGIQDKSEIASNVSKYLH